MKTSSPPNSAGTEFSPAPMSLCSDSAELVVAIEETFDFEIPAKDAAELTTVSRLVDWSVFI